ncbi:MAG: MG2 domain-containing protein [Sorangiineae bacterium]|nr:MG2 domain-containing protein [Sorangiineae bacterium]MEB2343320.1 MG2 domain-containing protein [Deltaproteobacteria bacterium]
MTSRHGSAARARARLRTLLGLLLLGITACLQGARVPAVTPRQTLAIGEGPGAAGSEGPFRVVYAAPSGEAEQGAELSIVFSRPLRALTLAGDEAPPPITLEPALEGRWQWVGTSALQFVPAAGRLPGATHVKVEVPAGTRALDGATLGAAHRFEFTTVRPALVRSSPSDRQDGLTPDVVLDLRFNQPIAPAALERAAKLERVAGGARKPIAFSVRQPDAAAPAHLELRPAAPLPIHSRFELVLAAELTGLEGPLPAGKAQQLEFETYGPLVVESLDCSTDTPHGRCEPGYLSLSLSNPVKARELERAISVEPPVKLRWESGREDDDYTRYVSLVGGFLPGRSYTVRVSGALTDKYGQRLAAPAALRRDFDDLWPSVEIGVSGDVLEPKSSASLPIGSVNTPRYELVAVALTPEDALAFVAAGDTREEFELLSKLRAPRVVAPRAAANAMATERLLPSELLARSSGRGALGVGLRYPGRGDRASPIVRAKIVQVTDLAITAKLSRFGSRVWVTRLSSGAPVAGAKVSIRQRGRAPALHTTDADGLVTIATSEFAPQLEQYDAPALIVVEDGADWSYRPVSDYLPPWRYGVAYDFSGEGDDYGMMFTERGIYRPGDALEVKAIVRRATPSGNQVLAGRPLTVVLRSPDGEDVAKKSVTTTRFGTFSTRFTVPRSAGLGAWSLETRGLPEGSVRTDFTVAEYRPVEFKVSAESDRPAYVRGEPAAWTVRGDYLYGAPMAGAHVRYTVTRSRTWFTPPDSEGFATDAEPFHADDDESALAGGALVEQEGRLDPAGAVRFDKQLELPGQRTPELVTVSAEVTDVARQSVGGGTSALVHPADFYLGVRRPEDGFVDAPGSFRAAVTAFALDGKRLGQKRVHVELVRRIWTLARQDVGGGRTHVVSRAVDRVVASCELTTNASSPATCDLPVKLGGYYLVHATAKDARGNLAEAALGLYGIGPGEAPWRDSDTRSLELVLDKEEYRVGDTARLLVKSPYPVAEALVTVERAGVYRQQRVTLRGSTPTLNVPVTAELGTNAFVSVQLVRGRTAPPPAARERPDVGAPTYRIGYASLRVDPSPHRLKVALAPSRKELRPGEELAVELAVTDARGRPAEAEVTLYAVDEGALSLINYQTPDPVQVFAASRPLEVATVESREALGRVSLEDLASAIGVMKGREGGDGGGGSARRDFRQSAYFNPSLVTDPSGKARVRFKLPESLTTFRLMAVAVTADDAYGFGEERVTTSQRLMARPALPRFLRAGDRVEAGVVLSAKDFGPARVEVRARVEGLELEGAPVRTVELGRNASVEVRFPMLAKTAGTAKLGFVATGGGARDAVEVTRRVDAPASFESVALYGQTTGSAGEQIGDLSKIRRDVGKLDVTVSSTALVGLGGGVEQLLDYPYGCTEQLSSRLVPLLPLRALARDFDIPLPKDLTAVVDKTVADILKNQRGDGGFGMWSDSPQSSPWVTAYALFSLDTARRHGATVPGDPLARGSAYLRRYLAGLVDDPLYWSSAAFMVDVLSSMGAPDPGYMTRLYESRDGKPVFARALLLHAMAVSKQGAESVRALAEELERSLRLDANTATATENLGDDYAVLMDSPARTTALLLRALLAVNPAHPLAAKLARGLLAARRGGSWRSTQETAYALLALEDYRKAQEKDAPDYVAKVWFSGAELFSATMKGRGTLARGTTIATGKLAPTGGLLVFDKRGSGTLFYEARLKYARQSLPTAALDRGFYVQKTLRAVTPEQLPMLLGTVPAGGSLAFSGGALVLADLVVVTASPRDYVVLEDPLPAGFEAVDASLGTTAAWLAIPGSGGEDTAVDCAGCDDDQDDVIAGSRAFLSSSFHRELRDDRVLHFVDHMAAGMYHYRYLARATSLGKFVVPPTRAEEMYSPEVFGRTAATTVEIR